MSDNKDNPAEAALIDGIIQRDSKAIAKLYDMYSPALYGVILRILKDENLSQDTLQEVFLKVWKKIDQYDRSRGRLFTWLLNIARNTALDVTRSGSYKAGQKVTSLDQPSLRTKGVEIAVEHIGLREVVDKLTPEHKQLIDLIYFGGFTQQEASDELGLPLGTVKSRVRAALKALRKQVT